MAANHKIIRKGTDHLIGEVNEEQKWKISASGFEVSNPIQSVWTAFILVGVPLAPAQTTPLGYDRIGNQIFLHLPSFFFLGTSNAQITSATGEVPVEFRPTATRRVPLTLYIDANAGVGEMHILANGTLQPYYNSAGAIYTPFLDFIGRQVGWYNQVITYNLDV